MYYNNSMNLKKILVKLINNYNDLKNNNGIIEQFQSNTGKKFYLKFEVPDSIDKNFAEILLDNIRNTLELNNDTDIKLLFKNGSVSLDVMNEYLNNLLTKTSCRHKEETCNVSYEPYNEFEFDTINPSSNPRRKYTANEIKDIKTNFNNKCSTDKGEKKKCCDPFDTKLKGSIPKYLLEKFKKIDVEKNCNNKITKIKVCNDDDCGEGNWKTPSSYELCKLMNLKPDEYKNKKEIDINTLDNYLPDCYYSNCNNNNIFLRIDQNNNNDEKINNHYYLIMAIKRDDVEHIKEYYELENNSVNEKLLYGYSGNTGFHNAIYYNAFKCIEYLLTTNFDYSNINIDNNSVLHIACLRGNYDVVFKLLKHGCKVECTNKFKDTALHSSVRSGSYNCVKILLQNNGRSCISKKNNYGEIPLHTGVLPVRYDEETDLEKKKEFKDRMNFNIIKLLIDYGSDIHSKNNDGDTILKTLSKKDKSLVREQIRTYIQRKYYDKYTSEEYNKLLKNYIEVRPFEIITDVDEKLKDTHLKYDEKKDYKNLIEYEDEIRDEELYIKKKTRPLKDFPKSIEHFSNDITNSNNTNRYNKEIIKYSNILAIVLLIIILLFILLK